LKYLLIKDGRVIDPKNNIDQTLDILIKDEKIIALAKRIKFKEAQVIRAEGKIVCPGLVDIHVHAREPGQERKETIRTLSRAAANGGFTTVVACPNTIPPIDTKKRVREVLNLAKRKSLVNFYTYACITKGMKGKEVVNVKGIKEAGSVGLTDDGLLVKDRKVMKEAVKEAFKWNIPVCPHCEENEGKRESEAKYLREYIQFILKKIPARFHIMHLSLKESVSLMEKAKGDGLPISCEATPHHFLLSERDYEKYGVSPPLRSKEDVSAIQEGLKRDIIDVIASDHAPHTPEEKASPNPPPGFIGLETTLGLVLTYLVEPGLLSLSDAIRKMTIAPVRILGIKGGELRESFPADLTIIDPELEWVVDVSKFESKGRNCPFAGWRLKGRAVMTIVRGRIIMSRMKGIKGRFTPKD
jgi:dihydroorotase